MLSVLPDNAETLVLSICKLLHFTTSPIF